MKKRKLVLSVVLILMILVIATYITSYTLRGKKIEKKLEVAYKFLEQEKFKKAIIEFETVLEIEPNNIEARFGLSKTYELVGEIDNAIKYLEEIKEIDKKNEKVYLKLYQLLIQKGNMEKAIEILEIGIAETESEELKKITESLYPKKPIVNLDSGEYEKDIEIRIESDDKIYYTLDGTKPNNNSKVYTDPIHIFEGEIALKVITINDFDLSSKVVVRNYKIFESKFIKLEDPNKIIEFVDSNFEKEIRKLYDLDKEYIYWKDIGYLENMEFRTNLKIESIEDIKWFINLKKLRIQGDVEGNLENLSDLKNLESINFDNTLITGDISLISDLSRLRFLSLMNTNIFGNTKDLKNLKEIELLLLDNTKMEGDISELVSLEYLKYIYLNDTFINGELDSLAKLDNIKALSLDQTSVKGDIIKLSELKNLENISLWNTSVIGDISVFSDLSKLNSIFLNSKYISGDLEKLSGLKNLKWLYLDKTSVSGNIKYLRDLIFLEEVGLDKTSVFGDISNLKKLNKLEYLGIDNTDCYGKLELYNGEIIKVSN